MDHTTLSKASALTKRDSKRVDHFLGCCLDVASLV
jgi:hypothetical protein